MSEPNRCPECGAEMPAGALAGLCPKCLLAAGMESGAEPQQPASGGSDAPTSPLGAGFVPPDPAFLSAHFPQLEILELLGCGGMGAVYKARQPRLDRLVALKIIRPASNDDPSFAERFNREARMLARLSHPHIVAVYDFGSVAISLREMQPHAEREDYTELYYFLMEYVEGANLRELMRRGELIPEQALAIVPQICEALQFAHDEGVVHRDIKPENILVDKKGRVKIADFGLAKLVGRSPDEFTLTGTHQVMGTPRYMAPEQMEGSHAVDHRADIYSLGVVFYEMLTGEVPIGHFEPPSKKVEIDVRLDEIVLRTLAREPQRRYQHASDVKSEVESISNSMRAAVTSPPTPLAVDNGEEVSWQEYIVLLLDIFSTVIVFLVGSGILVGLYLQSLNFPIEGVWIRLLQLVGLFMAIAAGLRLWFLWKRPRPYQDASEVKADVELIGKTRRPARTSGAATSSARKELAGLLLPIIRFWTTPQPPSYARWVGVPLLIFTGLWMITGPVLMAAVPAVHEAVHLGWLLIGLVGLPVAFLILILVWAVHGRSRDRRHGTDQWQSTPLTLLGDELKRS